MELADPYQLREEVPEMRSEDARILITLDGVRSGDGSSRRLSGRPVCVAWGVLAAVILTFAWHCWPVLDGDAINFVPNMVTYASDGSLVNTPSSIAQEVDSAGGGRLIHHGFLYEMVVGRISLFPTYPAVILTMAVVEVLALGACAFVLYRAANTTAAGPGWLRLGLVVFALGGSAASLVGLRGRPEPFGILLVASSASFMCLLSWRWHFLCVGGAMGLLAATHPVGALLCAPIAALYASVRCMGREWFAWLAKALLTSLAVFAAALAFYPYHLREWVEGLLRHYSIVSWHYSSVLAGDPQRVCYYWLTNPRAVLFGPLLLMSLVAGLCLAWRFRSAIQFKGAFVLCSFSFVIGAYLLAMRNPQNNYNLQLLTPVLYSLLIVFALGCLSPQANALPVQFRLFAVAIVLGGVALTGLGLARDVALFPFFLKHGLRYDQARNGLQKIRANWPERICITEGLFSLTEDYRNLNFKSETAKAPPILVVQQINSGLLLAPSLDNYVLVEDYFSPVAPRWLGIKIGNTVGGYNFAVYRRADYQKKQDSHD